MSAPPGDTEPLPVRVIGRCDEGIPGPTHVLVAGMHGNEPDGIQAARSLLRRLAQERPPLRGSVIAVHGNLQALAANVRYVARDLNRAWTAAAVEALRAQDSAADVAEEREQRALLAFFEAREAATREPLVVLDMHSSSAHGAPFTIRAGGAAGDALAAEIPVPILGGLAQRLGGTLAPWLAARGHTALVLEGGRHGHPDTARRLEAAAWVALGAGGVLPAGYRAVERSRALLEESSGHLPRELDVQYVHVFEPEAGFRMGARGGRPFESFDHVSHGDVLGQDGRGAVHSPFAGYVVMPLYQGQGGEGFFLARARGAQPAQRISG
jgi:succinylglutamate desuccinylase